MPEPEIKTGEGAGDQPKVPNVDVFGQGEPAVPPVVEKKAEEKKFDAIPADHPTIVSLTKQIEDVKREYGGNLSGQRDVIKTLTDKIEALTKGGKAPEGGKGGEDEGDVLFKKADIKYSKDLTQAERDDMTETEIKQMDEIANLKVAQNKAYSDQRSFTKKTEETKVTDLQSTVKATALELSKGEDGKENLELANQIIESVKQFNLEGLDDKTIKERVASAHKLLPDYKAPKESPTKNGKAVNGGQGGTPDEFAANDKIVEEATTTKGGNYAL